MIRTISDRFALSATASHLQRRLRTSDNHFAPLATTSHFRRPLRTFSNHFALSTTASHVWIPLRTSANVLSRAAARLSHKPMLHMNEFDLPTDLSTFGFAPLPTASHLRRPIFARLESTVSHLLRPIFAPLATHPFTKHLIKKTNSPF
jgi:hypothetical protein